jgi:hypothetical protein
MLENNNNVSSHGNIKFLGVARVNDKCVVASLTVKQDEDKAAYFTAVREVLSAQGFEDKIKPGLRFRLVGEVNAFNFIRGEDELVYMLITAMDYPERLLWKFMGDFMNQYSQQFGEASKTCVSGALDGKAKKLLNSFVVEYDDPTKDKLVAILKTSEDIKVKMNKNITDMLENIKIAESIEDTTQDLERAASDFHNNSKALKNSELWKKYRVYACCGVGFLIVIIFLILVIGTNGNNKITNPPTPTMMPTKRPGYNG